MLQSENECIATVLALKAIISSYTLLPVSDGANCRISSKQTCLIRILGVGSANRALQRHVFPAPGKPHVRARQTLALCDPP